MKRHEKQARAKGSADVVHKQPQNEVSSPASAFSQAVKKLQFGINLVTGTIESIIESAAGDDEMTGMMYLLRDHFSEIVMVAELIGRCPPEKAVPEATSEAKTLTGGQEFKDLEYLCYEAADLLGMMADRFECCLADCDSPGEGEGMRSLANRIGKALVVGFRSADHVYKETRQKAGAK